MPIPSDSPAFVGVIAPYDFALDREMWRWAPRTVDLLVTRTPQLGLGSTVEMAEAISSDRAVRKATQQLLTTAPSVVVYLCTSGSFVRGAVGERRLRRVMTDAGAPIAVTTAGAVVDACAALDVHRLAVATPYTGAVSARLHDFLAESGVDVVASGQLGREDRIWQVTPAEISALVRSVDRPDADGVFISCTNLRTYDLIPRLEDELGKPVLTANQVSLWAALRAAGIRRPYARQLLFRRTRQRARRGPRRSPSQAAIAALEAQPLPFGAGAPEVVRGAGEVVEAPLDRREHGPRNEPEIRVE